MGSNKKSKSSEDSLAGTKHTMEEVTAAPLMEVPPGCSPVGGFFGTEDGTALEPAEKKQKTDGTDAMETSTTACTTTTTSAATTTTTSAASTPPTLAKLDYLPYEWLARDVLEKYLLFPKNKVANKGRDKKDDAAGAKKKGPAKSKGKGESAYIKWDVEKWNADFPDKLVDLGTFNEFQYGTGVCDVPNGLFVWLPDEDEEDERKKTPSITVKVRLRDPTDQKFIDWLHMFRQFILDQWSKNSQALNGAVLTAEMIEVGMGKAPMIKKSPDANNADFISYRVPLVENVPDVEIYRVLKGSLLKPESYTRASYKEIVSVYNDPLAEVDESGKPKVDRKHVSATMIVKVPKLWFSGMGHGVKMAVRSISFIPREYRTYDQSKPRVSTGPGFAAFRGATFVAPEVQN